MLKANYLALARRAALRSALVFDKSIFLNSFLINIKESFSESCQWILNGLNFLLLKSREKVLQIS